MRNLFTRIGSVNFTYVVITFVRLKDQGCNLETTVLSFFEINLLKFHVEISGIFLTMKGWKLHFMFTSSGSKWVGDQKCLAGSAEPRRTCAPYGGGGDGACDVAGLIEEWTGRKETFSFWCT